MASAGRQTSVLPVFSPISVVPHREFARRRKKNIRSVKRKKDASHPDAFRRWRFADYLEKKDPDVSYWDESCEGWTIHATMLLERSVRLLPVDYEPSWRVEWRQFQDELDLVRKKQVPLEWIETRRGKLEEAAKVFRPNPRVTDADKRDDTKSLHRKLHRPLYLIIKRAGSDKWTLPTAKWETNETIRETAERMAKQTYGFDITHYLLGNAPTTHMVRDKTKIFFMHNLWVGGNVMLKGNKALDDFAWVTPAEFAEWGIEEDIIKATEDVTYMGTDEDILLPRLEAWAKENGV